jgi:type IV pilus assembly protein PilC
MPAYRYRAIDFTGRVARGQIAAANEWELAQNLSQSGLELIEARAKREAAPLQRLSWHGRLSPEELTRFSAHMHDLLKSGISFAEGLRDLARATESPALQNALEDIHRALSHGSGIAAAFARHSRTFPEIYIAILAAGEASGDLVTTFAHLARYAEARARMIEQLRRALRYPLFLVVVTIAVIGFMTTMVIPQIVQFLSSIDNNLPLSTRILITSAQLFADYWWVAALAVAAGIGAIAAACRYSERAAQHVDRLILGIPFLGSVLRKLALARFAHSFAILYLSNIGIVDSLRGASVTLGNRDMKAKLAEAERLILSGRPLSSALGLLFPPFAVHIVRIGERSGKLEKALDDIAAVCDRDVNEATTKLIGAMEPMLTLIVGMILAWVVLAVLGPIYGSLGKITGGMR